MGDRREEIEDVTEHPLANDPPTPPRGEDLPYDDGEPMESARHREQMNILIDTLSENREAVAHPFYAGGNMFVYFSETQARNNDFRGPDVFVVLNRPNVDRRSWVAWEEDGRLPDVVVELLSPKTEKIDRGRKFQIYRDVWNVRRYYLFDPWTLVFEGYALIDGAYVPIAVNEAGRLECRPLGLELGVQQTWWSSGTRPALRWFRADGTVLATAREKNRAMQEAVGVLQSDLDAARARAAALARRLAELEADGDAD